MGTLNRNLQTTLTVSVIPVLIELFARENMPAHHHDLVAKTRVNDGDLNKIGAIIVVVESKLVKAKKKQAQLQDKAIFFLPLPPENWSSDFHREIRSMRLSSEISPEDDGSIKAVIRLPPARNFLLKTIESTKSYDSWKKSYSRRCDVLREAVMLLHPSTVQNTYLLDC